MAEAEVVPEAEENLVGTQRAAAEMVDEEDTDEFFTPISPVSYWGRLYPADFVNVKFHDLVENEVTVGKLSKCDITIRSNEVPSKVLSVVSRQHFTIRRTQGVDRFGAITCKIVLEDLSMNGTYVNGERIGKGKMKHLPDNCVIAVGCPQNRIFYFKDASDGLVDDKLPPAINKNYHTSVQLGSGAYGVVTLVFSKESGRGYAMKTIIKNSNPGNKNRKAKSEVATLNNEIKILRKVNHPNVIRLVHDEDWQNQKYLFIELMRGNDLFARISDSKRLTERQSKLYFYQIASGVRYLHSIGIVHRDLKPENVLLATEDEDTIVKISDFGLSKVVNSMTFTKSLCGTKLYVAPEVLESRGSKKYTAQVDVWSMGVILFVCLSGQTPFCSERKGLCMEEQIKKGMYTMNVDHWECVSLQAKKLVRQMLTTNPVKRINISALFEDPWLKDQEMLSKVQQLISDYTLRSLGKENEPVLPVEEDVSLSPKPAKITLRSATSDSSPPRKRRRLI
ncbi:hypothetical protein FOCC_FOCC004220 [Frankliniella occidentalis]|uniref:Ovarian-specific serine/threonine-protein kinase Lok-like n=1 Tax=Frankliniella occidentalis TaxID=133901 RepID=A0A6J1RVW2_FRAOC|nr:ovarian-specific serine/threonine-protein kinase Lok-like [Frankliniella occidentalis]KAE8749053.1 hypothetical protein FOCC_FOCC004220 [Frankliniella occidentalis]